MKDVSAKGRKNLNQVLKRAGPGEILNQVQNDTFSVQKHDNGVWLSCIVIPNQVLNLALKQVVSS